MTPEIGSKSDDAQSRRVTDTITRRLSSPRARRDDPRCRRPVVRRIPIADVHLDVQFVIRLAKCYIHIAITSLNGVTLASTIDLAQTLSAAHTHTRVRARAHVIPRRENRL